MKSMKRLKKSTEILLSTCLLKHGLEHFEAFSVAISTSEAMSKLDLNINGVFIFKEELFVIWRLFLRELYDVRFAYFTTVSWYLEQYFTTMTDIQKVSYTF